MKRGALLEAILDELVRIRTALEARPAGRDAAEVELLRAVHTAVGARIFTSSDLAQHAALPAAAGLRAAILGCCRAVGARPIGLALRRMEGRDLGGLRVQRDRIERDGILWRVSAVNAVSFTAFPVAPGVERASSSGFHRPRS